MNTIKIQPPTVEVPKGKYCDCGKCQLQNKLKLIIAEAFSATPGPRYRHEGDFSGEEFRETILEPAIKSAIAENNTILVDLDGAAGYGTSFLEESFGGLIRINKYSHAELQKHLKLASLEEPDLIRDIEAYMAKAASKNEK